VNGMAWVQLWPREMWHAQACTVRLPPGPAPTTTARPKHERQLNLAPPSSSHSIDLADITHDSNLRFGANASTTGVSTLAASRASVESALTTFTVRARIVESDALGNSGPATRSAAPRMQMIWRTSGARPRIRPESHFSVTPH
jgi:hypothetical protein